MDASRSKAQAPELIGRLVEDFQAGIRQEENFRRLFDCYYGSVLRFFEKRGFSREEARDLTQETFIRVYKGMETFRRDARFDTWLFKIAANTYHKALRRHGARKRAGAHVGWESLTAETTGQLEAFEPASLAAGQEPLNQVLNAERAARADEEVRNPARAPGAAIRRDCVGFARLGRNGQGPPLPGATETQSPVG